MPIIRSLRLLGVVLAASAAARAATYDVGLPGSALQKLSDVTWAALQPGDIVNIHCIPGGYHEIIQISEPGTAAQPILIRGIPDPVTGALPVLDGTNAVEDPRSDFRSTGSTTVNGVTTFQYAFHRFGLLLVTPRAHNYLYGQKWPAYITIESLDIRNALYDPTGAITWTDKNGITDVYDPFACGIYVEFARNLTIRGCELSFNGNGIFVNSKNGVAQSSANLLVEKNYLHDNGQPVLNNQPFFNGVQYSSNAYGIHHIYTESVGAVFQFNRFGPLRAGCHGCMIKDRSSGTVIRYNSVVNTEGSAIFNILEPSGGFGYINLQPDYPDVFIYGNTITQLSAPNWLGTALVNFSNDGSPAQYAAGHRGTLYFYHNTVVNHLATVTAFALTYAGYAGSPSIFEQVDCRNNVFFTDSALQADIYHDFRLFATDATTTVFLGLNWVSPGTKLNPYGHPFAGTINGWSNLIFGDYAGQNLPGFASAAALNYHLIGGSDAIDAAGPLAPAALAKGYLVDQEYLAPQTHQPRVTLGSGPDLGALESSAAYLPPPNNHVPAAGAQSFNLIGSVATPLTLAGSDADGDALTYTITTPPPFGTLTGPAPTLVYTPPVGGGSVVIAYTVSDGYSVSKPGYIFVAYNSPGNPPPVVALTSPAAPLTLAASTPLTLTAAATDADGIKKVDFFDGPTLLGTATTAPYTLTVNSLAPGVHHLVAKAFDSLNTRTYSAPVAVTVP